MRYGRWYSLCFVGNEIQKESVMHPSELVLVPPGDVERWGALTGAAALLAYGARQRSLFGLCARKFVGKCEKC